MGKGPWERMPRDEEAVAGWRYFTVFLLSFQKYCCLVKVLGNEMPMILKIILEVLAFKKYCVYKTPKTYIQGFLLSSTKTSSTQMLLLFLTK